ncbi:MAG: hypothetical protein ACR2NZ_10540 [Rubripirellula sp.]
MTTSEDQNPLSGNDDAADISKAGGDRPAVRAKKRRRWLPKFRLMDLIWMVLLAAVLMKWQTDHRALVEANEKLETNVMSISTRSSWSIQQLLGKPNTFVAGDQSTAWASKRTDNSREWVVVEFPQEVELAKIEVFETYNPGAIDRICAVNFMGTETEIWKGQDPTPTTAAMGTSVFPISPGTQSRRIKLFINSGAVAGWNEIDAVAIHGTNGSKQWASDAWGSSSFGSNQPLPKWFWP